MTLGQLLSLLLVFLAIPAAGVCLYAWLCVRMCKRDIPEPPYGTYFFLFAHGGIWFLLMLTDVLWGWSGMSSLGAFYLMFVSPFPAVVLVFTLYDVRHESTFHRWAFWLCVAYPGIIVCLFTAGIAFCTVAQC